MKQGDLLLAGSAFYSHPAGLLLGLSRADLNASPSQAQMTAAKAVVIDCRHVGPAALSDKSGAFQKALAGSRPVLFLSPSEVHTEALAPFVNGCPVNSCEAMLVGWHQNQAGARDFDIISLEHHVEFLDSGIETSLSKEKQEQGDSGESTPEKPATTAAPCSCSCTCGGAATETGDATRERFVSAVVQYLERGRLIEEPTPPAGLKYFRVIKQTYTHFRYKNGDRSNKSDGTLTVNWVLWGFLNQTETSASQYLVVESAYSLHPGDLKSDGREDRGFVNAFLKGSVKAPLNYYAYQPTSGNNSWSGTVTLHISYKDPFGGYRLWEFQSSINNTVSDWGVKNISSGAELGSQWYMASPCDGTNLGDKWDDAFTFGGNVKSMPDASRGTLSVNSAGAWLTPQILSGNQLMNSNFAFTGCDFWGTGCIGWMHTCAEIHAAWTGYTWSYSFYVDFTSIKP